MKTHRFIMGAVVAVGMMLTAAGRADVTILQPKTVAAGGSGNYHDAFTTPYDTGSGGTIGYIMALYEGSYQSEYLVQFDQLSLWSGGPEAVTSATLKLEYYFAPWSTDTNPPPSLSVYRLTNSWVNGATWTSRGGALGAWATAGGDYDPTPVASLSFPTEPADYTIQSWDVTGLVSNWVAGTQPDYGFLLRWTPLTGFNREWFFAGPNGPTVGLAAPSLTLATIPEPSAMTLLGLSMIGAFIVRRSREE